MSGPSDEKENTNYAFLDYADQATSAERVIRWLNYQRAF